ncbi:hypothetical protein BCR32DRAFT_266151 [Anaeromyces robustus]|uniref:Uncharacterized protein n=1 Tax=Anaeromyces robustus TaxID=1754192 RepID=A0A1Y1XG24_9FUNG|nr:hypothetical protein BCR32DRAFT_266151 [Anaeromyces robustus]|eukprot:ORX84708.1 hypothetical protein BCR32DRAFT_266151 [Anaeromyces robustus]
MSIIHIVTFGLLLFIQQVYSKAKYEINVIPIDKEIFEAGVNNQIRISLWSKTRNWPVSLEEIEPLDNSLISVAVISNDLRAFTQFTMEDFPQYNNETNLPREANYFDIDYIFPIAGDYTITIKCRPYKRNASVNKVIHVEGKKGTKMNVDNALLPSDPNKTKTIYYKPVQLDNIKSIYRLPIIPHTNIIPEKDLKDELKKATGPIYCTKITFKDSIKKGYCSDTVLKFFKVELKEGKIKEKSVKDLFQYNNVPIRAILANNENSDYDIVQGHILKDADDHFPSCGNKITPPTEMVYGPDFGFSLPFREFGTYQIIFEISHSYDEKTYLLTPNVVVRVTENKDEHVEYAPQDYIDDDTNYDEFIQNVINKQISVPDSNIPVEDNDSNKPIEDGNTDEKTGEKVEDSSKQPLEKPIDEDPENTKITTSTKVATNTETPSPDDNQISDFTHGNIIIFGLAGIIGVSGFLFNKHKSKFNHNETIPKEYNQIYDDNNDDEDEENFEKIELLDTKSNISMDIENEEVLDTEDYTLMEDDN